MLHHLRFFAERNPAAHRVHQESFCGVCQGQGRFSGAMSSLAINYLQAYFNLIACGLEGVPAQKKACLTEPWSRVGVRRASPRAESFLAAVNLLLLGSWLRLQKERGDRRASVGLFMLRSGLRKSEEEVRGAGLEPERFQGLPLADPLSDGLPEVFAEVMVRLAELCGRPEQAEQMAGMGRALARGLVLWHVSVPPSPDNPDWFPELRQQLAQDPEGLRQRLESQLAELRTHLEALPLGDSQEAALAVVDSMKEGERVQQPLRGDPFEAYKRRWVQSGDPCELPGGIIRR
ncbi:hypothetical protein [Hyalangium minutum]|uniref:Uncharacterized protein n=1 Tax=Hyalangium minutum TaxID=394096 RepID=A0A085W8K7_9BACT|nr:hypothetical protein [Hyalangium minutum]KFE64020.1 hypothetical protein DB31_2433 [Hyalangium minutum]